MKVDWSIERPVQHEDASQVPSLYQACRSQSAGSVGFLDNTDKSH